MVLPLNLANGELSPSGVQATRPPATTSTTAPLGMEPDALRLPLAPSLSHLLGNRTHGINGTYADIASGRLAPCLLGEPLFRPGTAATTTAFDFRVIGNQELLERLSRLLMKPATTENKLLFESAWASMAGALTLAGRLRDVQIIGEALKQLKSYCVMLRDSLWRGVRIFANGGKTDWEEHLRAVADKSMPTILRKALEGEPIVPLVLSPAHWVAAARKYRDGLQKELARQQREQEACRLLQIEHDQLRQTRNYYKKYPCGAAINRGDRWWLKRNVIHYASLEDALRYGCRGRDLKIVTRQSFDVAAMPRVIEESVRGKETVQTSVFGKGQARAKKRFVIVRYGPGTRLAEVRVRTPVGYTVAYLGEDHYVYGDGEPMPYPEWLSPRTLLLNRKMVNRAISLAG